MLREGAEELAVIYQLLDLRRLLPRTGSLRGTEAKMTEDSLFCGTPRGGQGDRAAGKTTTITPRTGGDTS